MFPIELSGGMKQRMVMVLSTLLDPSLLIADEITSALDVSTQKAVAEMLVEFRDRGFVKSTIVITHDSPCSTRSRTRSWSCTPGKLAEKASAEAIIHSPLHPYTQLLISSLPEVGVRYEEEKLAGIPGQPPGLLDPPERLPVPRPLPARVREVRRGAALRRGRARPFGRLLEGSPLSDETATSS